MSYNAAHNQPSTKLRIQRGRKKRLRYVSTLQIRRIRKAPPRLEEHGFHQKVVNSVRRHVEFWYQVPKRLAGFRLGDEARLLSQEMSPFDAEPEILQKRFG